VPRLHSLIIDFPTGLLHKSRECEPVVVYVFLEVRVGNQEERVERRRFVLK
jgi:hypothetical protein